MNIINFDNIFGNLLLGFMFMVIGFYILAAILEFIASIFKINISIFDTLFVNNRDRGKIRDKGEMILQKSIGNIYSIFIEIFLWLIPIACALTAGILMKGFHWGILGAIAGIFIDVILYGTTVILFDIRSSLKKIKNK